MEHPPRRQCILLVDDHEDTLTLQAILLRRAGYEVVTAKDAETAMQAAATTKLDLVVSDLNLPDRNGVALMQDLHARYGLPGVAFTGAADEAEAATQAGAGIVACLIKPVTPEDLVQSVRSIISSADEAPQ